MIIPKDQPFDSAPFFAGGAGMFVEFHDIVKPVYMYAVMKMIITKESYGLPTDIIKEFSIASLLEWYHNRRYRNPLKQLDWMHKIPENDLDNLMKEILKDESIYTLAPDLNICRMVSVYRMQHMVFPWFIYSEEYEPGIEKVCKKTFAGIKYTYLHGDLKQAISKCDQNYTYIFSDIEKVKMGSEILHGTCSHLLIARDYRYNLASDYKTMKYDLGELAMKHPFLRIDTITAMDNGLMQHSFDNIIVNNNERSL